MTDGMDEMRLYLDDRPKWIERVADGAAKAIVSGTRKGAVMRWRFMARDYQLAVWAKLSKADQAKLKAAIAASDKEKS